MERNYISAQKLLHTGTTLSLFFGWSIERSRLIRVVQNSNAPLDALPRKPALF